MTLFISGHLDVSPEEFTRYYAPHLTEAHQKGARFVVGDARGADTLAQAFLRDLDAEVVVYHLFEQPRNNGFSSENARDAAMTAASEGDIAWIRPGREKSGTARNLARRIAKK
jgi:hypothetical protein